MGANSRKEFTVYVPSWIVQNETAGVFVRKMRRVTDHEVPFFKWRDAGQIV
jgi:hypothetical protein